MKLRVFSGLMSTFPSRNMYRIHRETIIRTTQKRCFDLSRSIDFHKDSMGKSNEVAVGGRTSGLIELNEFVEWEATHLMVRQRLSSKITQMVRPFFFVDEQVSGAFKSFWHKHDFRVHAPGEVLMIDDFRYETPFSIFGKVAYHTFLKNYMERLIGSRCIHTKEALESSEWKKYLPEGE